MHRLHPAQNNANTINELLTELIELGESMNLARIGACFSDASHAKTIKQTIQKLVTEIVSLKTERASAEPNAEAHFRDITETIDIIIADFMETNNNGIERQLIQEKINAELVSFTKSELFLLFLLA